MCWQVYLARWHETLVAVKLLIGSAAELAASSEEAADRVLSLSSPILANLQQVRAPFSHQLQKSADRWCWF